MSDKPTRDPIDELRRANPLRDEQLSASSRDRLWSRIQETRMSEQTPQTDPGQTRLARWTIAASAATLVAVVVAALTLGGTAAPSPQTGDEGSGGGGGMSMCLAFTMEDLQARDFAFDGTVTAIDGTQATFTVNDGFWGVEDGASITLGADLMVGEPEVVALEGGPLLIVGDRYLVSGDDSYAWSCGYTLVYDEATAAEWAAAAP